MAIKTTEIGDKVQILKGTVQKQMILRYFCFKLKKKCCLVVVIELLKLFASVTADGQHYLLSVCPVSRLYISVRLSSKWFKKVKNKKKQKTFCCFCAPFYVCHVTEGDLSQFPLLNTYADTYIAQI